MGECIEEVKKIRAAMDAVGAFLTDEQALTVPALFPKWKTDTKYVVETNEHPASRVSYGDTLYKCITAHTSQSTWTPDTAHSLWTRIDDPSIEWPEWVQPESTNPYAEGAKVTHNSKKWISTVPNNVWEPGVYGWTEYTEE